MPLFFRKKKPSEDAQKRLEYLLCRSKEAGSDDVLDISSCELSEIPSTVFSNCKHFQKKVLIVHSNEIKSLFQEVLDLHENRLTSLPDDVGKLTSLQILNLEKNHLKMLPDSIGELRLLQTLNLKGNELRELPSSVGSLSSLRTLDVSDNHITHLPKAVGLIRTLESFTLDAAKMVYPPDSVCKDGTESIQRFFCSELGQEYCPPSQYLLPVLENDSVRDSVDCLDGQEEAWLTKFSDYEKRKEQKHLEKVAFERQLEEKHKEHTQLLLLNNSFKENILNSVRQEQERIDEGLTQQQKAQEAERLLVLEKVRQAEYDITSRIDNMLTDNNRQKKSAEFLQSLEEERLHMEQLTAITQEEANSLRKREVAAAMQKMLSDSCAVRLLQKQSDSRRQSLVSEAYRSMETMDRKFEKMLALQVLDKSKAIAHILQEEEMQKAAFQALQLQKDSVHGYICNQLELERKSESSEQNYWMIQYQRLLDAKPISLRMQEAGVEIELVNLLCRLSVQHYLPILAHHRITAKSLRQMSPADLKKLGINEVGIQKALLKWAKESEPQGACKAAEAEDDEAGPSAAPTAPSPSLSNRSPIHYPSPPLTPGTPVTPSAPSPVDGPGTSECVVCMETGSQVIFLPCGHVCCCQVCSDALQNCPMCRATISQRIRLFHS
ncbi:hypothetical protein WMY93_021139 [Mugilogobius chulae]|uniref:RING-type domain-containing protein n=1 Tax=Mugilogobius chulae TaxID=88201 RepID=A0AAW0NEE5_9GOBI